MRLVACQNRLLPIVRSSKGCKRQRGSPPVFWFGCSHESHELVTVHAWHSNITYEDVRLGRLEPSERLFSRANCGYRCALVLQYAPNQFKRIGLVVDN